jgi:hypothetical protein
VVAETLWCGYADVTWEPVENVLAEASPATLLTTLCCVCLRDLRGPIGDRPSTLVVVCHGCSGDGELHVVCSKCCRQDARVSSSCRHGAEKLGLRVPPAVPATAAAVCRGYACKTDAS